MAKDQGLLFRGFPENKDWDNEQEILSHRNRKNRVQCPDLLVYAANYSDWYFCEIKADADTLRKEQLVFFEELFKATGKQIALIKFTKSDSRP